MTHYEKVPHIIVTVSVTGTTGTAGSDIGSGSGSPTPESRAESTVTVTGNHASSLATVEYTGVLHSSPYLSLPSDSESQLEASTGTVTGTSNSRNEHPPAQARADTVTGVPVTVSLFGAAICVPPAINGIALGNIGVAVALRNILRDNGLLGTYSSWAVYALVIYAIALLALYLVRVVFNPGAFLREDCAKPQPLSAIGAHSMAVLLLAVVAAYPELQLNYQVSLAIAVYGSAVQLGSMSVFFYRCWTHSCWPEPIYNASSSIHSAMFTVIALPSINGHCEIFRKVNLVFGLFMLVPSLPTQIIRVLAYPEAVAQTYTCCIMQAAFSISLTAWLTFPFASHSDPTFGVNAAISHLLFSFSTVTYLLTWYGLYQRRHTLRNLGAHPSISSASFPFVNSAISANLYRINFYRANAFSESGHRCLQAWIYLVTLIAFGTTLSANVIYLRNRFFSTAFDTADSKGVSGTFTVASLNETKAVEVQDYSEIELALKEATGGPCIAIHKLSKL